MKPLKLLSVLILTVLVLVINPLSLHAQENRSEALPLQKTKQKIKETITELQPVKQKTNKSVKNETESAQETQPTSKPSPRVTETPPKPLEESPNQGVEERQQQVTEVPEFVIWFGYKFRIADGLLVLFTLLLVGVGIAQAWFNRSLRNNQRIIERAYVKMSHFPPGLDQIADSPQHDIRIQIKNFGNTPARITQIIIKYGIVPHDQPLPTNPDYVGYERGKFNTNIFLVHEDEFTFFHTLILLADELGPVQRRENDLYVFGYVDYIDQFGTRHRAGYARIYDPRIDHRDSNVSDEAFRKRNNLDYIIQAGYNYDHPRNKREYHDWETHL